MEIPRWQFDVLRATRPYILKFHQLLHHVQYNFKEAILATQKEIYVATFHELDEATVFITWKSAMHQQYMSRDIRIANVTANYVSMLRKLAVHMNDILYDAEVWTESLITDLSFK